MGTTSTKPSDPRIAIARLKIDRIRRRADCDCDGYYCKPGNEESVAYCKEIRAIRDHYVQSDYGFISNQWIMLQQIDRIHHANSGLLLGRLTGACIGLIRMRSLTINLGDSVVELRAPDWHHSFHFGLSSNKKIALTPESWRATQWALLVGGPKGEPYSQHISELLQEKHLSEIVFAYLTFSIK